MRWIGLGMTALQLLLWMRKQPAVENRVVASRLQVFIGSCTNSRIEDIRQAAAIAAGRHVAEGVYAMVVPGSGLVKQQAEEEGLDK